MRAAISSGVTCSGSWSTIRVPSPRSPVTSPMPDNCRTCAIVTAIQPPQVQPLTKKPALAGSTVVACSDSVGPSTGRTERNRSCRPVGERGLTVGVAAGADCGAGAVEQADTKRPAAKSEPQAMTGTTCRALMGRFSYVRGCVAPSAAARAGVSARFSTKWHTQSFISTLSVGSRTPCWCRSSRSPLSCRRVEICRSTCAI